MKNLTLVLISFFVISCKSNSKLIGEYLTNSANGTEYIFNFKNKQYTKRLPSGSFAKGKFEILTLSSEKTLLVCNDKIWKRTDDFSNEQDKAGDSIVDKFFNGYKNLGETVFEITSKEANLLYRKTYTNDLQKTESEGILIKR